jgi:hypothetical protein
VHARVRLLRSSQQSVCNGRRYSPGAGRRDRLLYGFQSGDACGFWLQNRRQVTPAGGDLDVSHQPLVDLPAGFRDPSLLPVLSVVRAGDICLDGSGRRNTSSKTSALVPSLEGADSTTPARLPRRDPGCRRFGLRGPSHTLFVCILLNDATQVSVGQSGDKSPHSKELTEHSSGALAFSSLATPCRRC